AIPENLAGYIRITAAPVDDIARPGFASGLSTLIKDHLVGAASRLAALILPQILPVFLVVTPCQPGAALRDLVLVQRGQATSPTLARIGHDSDTLTSKRKAMTKRVVLSALMTAVILPFPARAQTKPDFSGTWTLDASKSDAPMGRR